MATGLIRTLEDGSGVTTGEGANVSRYLGDVRSFRTAFRLRHVRTHLLRRATNVTRNVFLTGLVTTRERVARRRYVVTNTNRTTYIMGRLVCNSERYVDVSDRRVTDQVAGRSNVSTDDVSSTYNDRVMNDGRHGLLAYHLRFNMNLNYSFLFIYEWVSRVVIFAWGCCSCRSVFRVVLGRVFISAVFSESSCPGPLWSTVA